MSKSDPVRVLVVGGGSIGERHARCFLRTGRCRVSLCEINTSLREQLQQRYELDAVYGDLDAALEPSPDVVVICTPGQFHVPMAMKAMEAGAHVLIEKPLSVSLEGVGELVEMADALSQSKTVGVAYTYRSHPVLTEMKQAIDSGRFGRPLQIVASGGQHFPFYRPAYRETYYTSHASGGGAIQDALTHQINAGEWLVGPMVRLAADAAHLALEGVEVEDTVHVIGRQGRSGEVLASYSLNQHQAPNDSKITVVCEGGTARFEMSRNRWLSCTEPGDPWHEESAPVLERDDVFVNQAGIFLDVIEDGGQPPCTLREGLQTLRVNLAVLEAARSGRWVTVDETAPHPTLA